MLAACSSPSRAQRRPVQHTRPLSRHAPRRGASAALAKSEAHKYLILMRCALPSQQRCRSKVPAHLYAAVSRPLPHRVHHQSALSRGSRHTTQPHPTRSQHHAPSLRRPHPTLRPAGTPTASMSPASATTTAPSVRAAWPMRAPLPATSSTSNGCPTSSSAPTAAARSRRWRPWRASATTLMTSILTSLAPCTPWRRSTARRGAISGSGCAVLQRRSGVVRGRRRDCRVSRDSPVFMRSQGGRGCR